MIDTSGFEQLEQEWLKEIYDMPGIDISDEYHWTSLKYGWALGKGFPPFFASMFSQQGRV